MLIIFLIRRLMRFSSHMILERERLRPAMVNVRHRRMLLIYSPGGLPMQGRFQAA
jgi:hypothetical protein